MNDEARRDLVYQLLTDADRTSALRRMMSLVTTLKGKNRDVAQFVIHNVHSLGQMTIEQIATACDTSRATITRMSNELGYDNFSQLRQALLSADENDRHSDETDQLHDTMRRCITMLLDTYSTINTNRIEQAAELLASRSPITVYGGAMSGGMARIVQNWFRWMGLSAYTVSDMAEIALSVQHREGVFFCISHAGTTPHVRRVLMEAGRHHIPTILLVNLEGSPAAQHADIVLSTNITSFQTHGYDALARTSELFVVKMLSDAIGRRINGKTDAHDPL